MSTEMESFAQLFEESLARKEMRLGEVITAEVVRVDYNVVVVNAGLKSEAYVPIEEFKNDRGEVEVKAGDLIQVAQDGEEAAGELGGCQGLRPRQGQAVAGDQQLAGQGLDEVA